MAHNTQSPRQALLFSNLLKVTYEFIKSKHYTPHTEASLIDTLRIHPEHLAAFGGVLKQLREEGKVALTGSQQQYLTQPGLRIVVGTICVHPRGFGFVSVKESNEPDVFIPKPYLNSAVDGDTVEVLIDDSMTGPKGPEGKVVAIIERKRKQLVAIVTEARGNNALCYSTLLGTNALVTVPQPSPALTVGDRVVLDVTDWGSQGTPAKAQWHHTIGHIADTSRDIDVAVAEFSLRSDFPKACLDEARHYGDHVPPHDLVERKDLQALECVTIDPDTAKDFDDALSISHEGDTFVLGVHIADVSHYVREGTALDQEAMLRCNSTYFPARCIPMLPHTLSDNLCSLKEGVTRLTMSVMMRFDTQGTLLHYDIFRSAIKSAKRFTYKQAKMVLDGTMESPHAPMLQRLVQLCLLLKGQRKTRGSVELSMPDLVVHVDEQGKPTGTELIEYDITHQLVEECMLKANEVVAQHLARQGKEVTYRVHEEPAQENLRDFAALATAFGYKLSENPTPQEIQRFFAEADGSPYAQYLATCYIRSMKLAIYSSDNIGHYGLSLQHYCHFTSPIRRYVDLVVHRLLFTPTPPEKKVINEICRLASERERFSAKAEQSVVRLKKLRLLQEICKRDKDHVFEAVVTKVKPFGISFDVVELMFDGFLHVSALENDYFVYDEARMLLEGRHHGTTFHAGDVIRVRLQKLDLLVQEATWGLMTETPATPHQGKKRRRRR